MRPVWPIAHWLVCVLFVSAVVQLACRPDERSETAVYLVEPGRVLALDARDGRRVWEATVPFQWVCDLAPSPDGRWIAVLQGKLVLVATHDPVTTLTLDPPEEWYFIDCFQTFAHAEIPWALVRWLNDETVLVLVRKTVRGRELRAVAAYDLAENTWRPWIQHVALGCWLLAEPTAEFQLSCERFPDPKWPPAVAGLLGIEPVNGGIQRRLPLVPPESLRQVGIPFGSPVVGVAEVDGRTIALAESGLFLVFREREDATTGIVVWRAAGLPERASGKVLRLAADERVVWTLLWRSDAPPLLVLLDLRSLSIARIVPFAQPVVDVDLLADGSALVLRDLAGTLRLERWNLRSGEERTLAMLPGGTTCCWVGPLARG